MALNTTYMDKVSSQKPLISLARPTAARMWLVNLCAFMAIIQSSLSDSFSSLIVALSAVAAALFTEFLILRKRGKTGILLDGSAVASALILTLLLPSHIPPLCAAAGAAFAMAVIKHSFGGLGSNWLNPAAGGWLFIRISWPELFNRALEGSPLSILAESINRGVTNPEGSPLGILKIDAAHLFAASSPLDGSIRAFFNNSIFSLSGAELPGGYVDLLFSRFPGIIADRGGLALLVGTLIITASQVNRAWIPGVFLACFGLLVRFAGALPYGGIVGNGDVLFSFFSGGTLVAAFLLASDPATNAKSNRGILFVTVMGGIAAFFFRYFGAEPYGAVYAVLFVNAMLPLLRIFENRWFFERRGMLRNRDLAAEAGPKASGAKTSYMGFPGMRNPGGSNG